MNVLRNTFLIRALHCSYLVFTGIAHAYEQGTQEPKLIKAESNNYPCLYLLLIPLFLYFSFIHLQRLIFPLKSTMYLFSAVCIALAGSSVATAGSLSPELTKRSTISLTGSDPIPFFDLATATRGSLFVASPIDVESIRNTLAHYPLAIDGKNFAALNLVFTPNAVANYSAPLNVVTGLATIESVLEASLAPVTTQHSYGTQVIDVLSANSAFSVTYFTATHFGKGEYLGQILTSHGQYQDVLARQKDLTWRITHRNLVFMVSQEYWESRASLILSTRVHSLAIYRFSLVRSLEI
jgi:ketosteroid isomerase-like protein